MTIEEQIAALRELQACELALDINRKALVNETFITAVHATDTAQSHRSVEFVFTQEESRPILELTLLMLEARRAKIKG